MASSPTFYDDRFLNSVRFAVEILRNSSRQVYLLDTFCINES